MAASLFHMLVFPGFLFLILFALSAEYVDRKLYAKLQNRVGPPWFQPLADFVKLAAKEDLVPAVADPTMFQVTPVVALTAVVTAFFYIPVWRHEALFSFDGDVIVVLYLLMIPTITFFLGGWYSRSVFSMLGAARAILQLFAYEIPFFLGILGPALLANSWSLSHIAHYYQEHWGRALLNVTGLVVSLVALLGKLERVPFDIPEAETEIVAGSFTEYSGRLLALFRLTISIEMIVGATLIAAVFVPFGLDLGGALGFPVYVAKVLVIVGSLAVARSVFARLRIDQMINFCWQFGAPIAFGQVLLDLVAKGVLPT
jgi:NADH-quinone oxidoreductase subunit H